MTQMISHLVALALLAGGGQHETTSTDNTNVTPVTCSELCVRMLCDTWGVQFDRAQAVNELSQESDGSVPLDRLVACLNSFGFECDVRHGTPELLNNIQRPVIIHLQHPGTIGSVGHYVVVARSEAGLIAYDPIASSAPGSVDPERLKIMWTGVAVFVHPYRLENRILFWSNLCAGLMGIAVLLLYLHRKSMNWSYRLRRTPTVNSGIDAMATNTDS